MKAGADKVYKGVSVSLFLIPWCVWIFGGAVGLWWRAPNKIVSAAVGLGWLLVLAPFLLGLRALMESWFPDREEDKKEVELPRRTRTKTPKRRPPR